MIKAVGKVLSKILGSVIGSVIGIAITYLIIVAIVAFVSGEGFSATAQSSVDWFSKLLAK